MPKAKQKQSARTAIRCVPPPLLDSNPGRSDAARVPPAGAAVGRAKRMQPRWAMLPAFAGLCRVPSRDLSDRATSICLHSSRLRRPFSRRLGARLPRPAALTANLKRADAALADEGARRRGACGGGAVWAERQTSARADDPLTLSAS